MTRRSAASPIEPERYELHAAAATQAAARASATLDGLSRRHFFATLGPGLLVISRARDGIAAEESGRPGRGGDDAPTQLSAFIHIGANGKVTVMTGKAEVGQNIRTSLSQAVAEELRVPLASIELAMADTALVPFDRGTFGSRTTPDMAPRLRKVAATARVHLAALAAERWKVSPGSVSIADGTAVHAETGRRSTFGALTRGRTLVHEIDGAIGLVPPGDWKVCGTSAPKVDARAFVTGRHRYTSDVSRPGMLIGKILRPPRFGVRLATVDESSVRAVHGVATVRDGDLIGVVAPDEPTADRALAALAATAVWADPTGPASSSSRLFDHLRNTARTAEIRAEARGDVARAFAGARLRLQAAYTADYIAHVPLEPRAAVAEWKGDAVTAWTGTQRPFGVREELAAAFGIAKDRVRVIVPDTGSGYGGKHTGEAAIEAACLARAAKRPVRIVWTREEEFTWAYFRPAALIDIRAAVGPDGRLLCWDVDNFNAGTSGLTTPYDATTTRHAFVPTDAPLRQGSYRGLAATANHFAREVHMDELAALVKMDTVAFRRKNLSNPRLRAVLDAAVARSGWQSGAAAAGHGRGVAIGLDKGGFVATCAEVVAAPGNPTRVTRLVTAFECGAVVNPEHLRNQIEGGVVMGLGGALTEAIIFEEGKILNPRLSQYDVPRFSDLPKIETVLVNRPDLPSSGAGETPIVAVAPAIANAVFAATGRRLRALPMRI